MHKMIYCTKNGSIHSTIPVEDADVTGYSASAHKAGWLQINTVSGRTYTCPECWAEDWEGKTEDMGR